MKYLDALVPKLMNPKTLGWVEAMYPCLIGIAQNSPDLVAEGLTKTLAASRRRAETKLEKIVCTYAHGIYQLCRWVSPKLVATFDANQPLPWDAEYAQWVCNTDDPAKYIDFEDLSPMAHKWVRTLERPRWWS